MVYDFFYSLENYQVALLSVMGGALLIQLIYYVGIYGKVGRYKQVKIDEARTSWPAVSVVICAKNEYDNLEKNIPLIAEQDYPNYEVIIVDDCSEDNTPILIKNFRAKFSHVRSTFIKKDDKFSHGKKLALTVGIKSASHEILILTDADCTPKTNQWLRLMVCGYGEGKDVVLGYCGFEKRKGFLNRIIRCEALFVGMNYLGLALSGAPYMGVGRNLSYKKSLFLKNRGFASHHALLSGDDDLFVNEVSTKRNTGVAISKKALLVTDPKQTWGAWIQQKVRHGSTYKHYKLGSKFNLSMEMVSRLVFWASSIASIFLLPIFYIGISAILLRFIVIAICYKVAINKLQERGLWIPSMLFDIISPVLYLAIYLKRKFTPKRQQWI